MNFSIVRTVMVVVLFLLKKFIEDMLKSYLKLIINIL